MRISFHLPRTVPWKRRCYAAVILALLTLSGCCIETKGKPGVVVRGDWSVELNRSRAIEEGSRKKKQEHHAPCGKWGCLICALGPSTGEEGCGEATEEQKPLTITPPQYMGQYPLLYNPSIPHPGISPFYAGTPGFGGPPSGPIPPPIPVINPRTGQQHLMQPVMPGQPGVLMLHAQNGQPVMVNPAPPLLSPLPPYFAGIPPLPLGIQPSIQPGILPPYGMQPPYGSSFPPPVPSGMAMVDPNPYAPPPQGGLENQVAEKTAAIQDAPQSQMPTPRFHSVPTQPVFQRTTGLATTKEAEEEQRLRQLKLEKALGMKVPEGAKIAPNGVNQQILQTGAISGKGGGPVNGSPFSSINGILGMNESKSKQPLGPAEMNYLKTQEQQIYFQKAQIAELQKELQRSRWRQLLESQEITEVLEEEIEFENVVFVEEEVFEDSSVPVWEQSPLPPMKAIPNPPALKPSRSHSFSPMGWLAPSVDAERVAQIVQRSTISSQKKDNLLTRVTSNLSTPSWMVSKPPIAAKVQRSASVNPLLRQESVPNPIQQAGSFVPALVSTEVLLEEDEDSPLEQAEILQLRFQEEQQPVCPVGNEVRKNAPTPHFRPGQNISPIHCVPQAPVPLLNLYGKR